MSLIYVQSLRSVMFIIYLLEIYMFLARLHKIDKKVTKMSNITKYMHFK